MLESLQEMLRFDVVEDVFFDTAESFSSLESFVDDRKELGCGGGYDIWLELKSVKERREKFLLDMGFIEASSFDIVAPTQSETVEMDRIVEYSGAVTNSCGSSAEEDLACDRREYNCDANCLAEESEHEWMENLSADQEKERACYPCSALDHGSREAQDALEDSKKVNHVNRKKMRNWWKGFLHKTKKNKVVDASGLQRKVSDKRREFTRMKVQQKKKNYIEFTAVYTGQEISAHKGQIWTMKFSPDGHYLASGGEDGVIRVWSVSSVDSCCKNSPRIFNGHKIGDDNINGKKLSHSSVVIPEKVIRISDSPVHEFRGHASDILDLAWSTSNHLLSSSKDETVRLWQVGSDECISVFLHSNYVTCIQFNPVDENCFITGSVDGKVRVWGVPEKRVLKWAETRNAITAVCYQPNGKGFVTGSVSGTCRFFELSGGEVLLSSVVQISGKSKSSGNKITGIQFLANDSRRVMVTSDDSKIRILDGVDVVHKYKGLSKSGSQMSASLTPAGQHIISVGKDSRVYIWNYDHPHLQSSKAKRSVRSCEYFFFDGVSVVLPWSSMGTKNKDAWPETEDRPDLCSWARDPERFSLASWFSMDVSSKGSLTWPEEKLPICEVPSIQQDNQTLLEQHGNDIRDLQWQRNTPDCKNYSATWGLVIVTAGCDGMIRTFHNYGLPTKI